MAQPGDVVITTKEVFDEVRATHDAVNALRSELKSIRDTSKDHESRLRALERRVWIATGGGTVLGAVAGGIVNVLFGA